MDALAAALVAVIAALVWAFVRALIDAEAVGFVASHCRNSVHRQAKKLEPEVCDVMREAWLGELAECEQRPLTALWWTHIVVRRGCNALFVELAQERMVGDWRPQSRVGVRVYFFIDRLLEIRERHLVDALISSPYMRRGSAEVAKCVDLGHIPLSIPDQEIVFDRARFSVEFKRSIRLELIERFERKLQAISPEDPRSSAIELRIAELQRILS